RQRAHGNALHEWLQQRLMAAERRQKKRLKAERRARAHTSRGVDRVPAQLRDVERPVQWLVQHAPAINPVTGRWVKGTPYRNPDRVARLAKSGRLRAELLD